MEQPLICAEDLIALNHDDYKPSDNRTHVDPILSYDPIMDMRIRKTIVKRDEPSHQSYTRTLCGNAKTAMFTESQKPKFTPVLYFPKENEIGMKKVSESTFPTVYPQSIVERFDMNNGDVQDIHSIQLKHSMPIYFSAKTERLSFL